MLVGRATRAERDKEKLQGLKRKQVRVGTGGEREKRGNKGEEFRSEKVVVKQRNVTYVCSPLAF